MGFLLFKLCLMQVLRNWKMALRLSLPYFLLLIVFLVVAQFLAVTNMANITDETASRRAFLTLLIAAPFLIAIFSGMIIIAIGWHRYVLLGDPGTVAYVLQPIGRVGLYFWQGLKVFLIVLISALIVTVAVTFLLSPLLVARGGAGGLSTVATIVALCGEVIVTWYCIWVTLRLGLSLPAAALSKRMTLTESQSKTSSLNGSIAMAALLVALLQTVPVFIFGGLALVAPSTALVLVSVVLEVVIGFINFFISFGILTVLYGHIVDGRPIDV